MILPVCSATATAKMTTSCQACMSLVLKRVNNFFVLFYLKFLGSLGQLGFGIAQELRYRVIKKFIATRNSKPYMVCTYRRMVMSKQTI